MVFREEMLEAVKAAHKRVKGVGIAISIIMILLGIALFFIPESAPAIAMWIMVCGLLFRGIDDIITFIKTPKGYRDGWDLAAGIIWVVIAVLLIIGTLSISFASALVAWGSFEMFIGFLVGLTTIFVGIKQLCSCSEVKAMGGSTGLCIVSGIISIFLGLVILTYPVGSILTITLFYGLFLLVGGISMLIRTISL